MADFSDGYSVGGLPAVGSLLASAPILASSDGFSIGGMPGIGSLLTATTGGGFVIYPTGSILFLGTIPFIKNKVLSPNGAITFTGIGSIIRTKLLVTGGVVTFSGLALIKKLKILSTIGNITFSGTAPIIFIGNSVASKATWRTLTGIGR